MLSVELNVLSIDKQLSFRDLRHNAYYDNKITAVRHLTLLRQQYG